jgi:hypothetical protein
VNIADDDDAVGDGVGPLTARSHTSSIIRSGSGSASR